jgi:hypothetical protein
VNSWDIRGLKTAVHVEGTLNDPTDKDKAWTVEMAVPFAVLRECVPGKPERPSPGDQWRVNFSRVEYRLDVVDGAYVKAKDRDTGQALPEDNWTWAPQGVVNVHYPEMWGFVQFSGKQAGAKLERFVDKPEDRVKWALRRVYYRQRTAYAERQAFAPDLAALGLDGAKELKLKGWSYPPLILTTPSLFEAVYTNQAGVSWHIRQDGLVWPDGPDGRTRK